MFQSANIYYYCQLHNICYHWADRNKTVAAATGFLPAGFLVWGPGAQWTESGGSRGRCTNLWPCQQSPSLQTWHSEWWRRINLHPAQNSIISHGSSPLMSESVLGFWHPVKHTGSPQDEPIPNCHTSSKHKSQVKSWITVLDTTQSPANEIH